MKNRNLVAALQDVTVDQLAAAERIIDAHLTITFLRFRSDPSAENENAWDSVLEDKKTIADALWHVKQGARTCTDR